MQFLEITEDTKLADIANTVGDRNVEYILAANDIQRTPQIGKAFAAKCSAVIESSDHVDWQRKSTILNTLTQDSDAFETAALLSSSGWKLLSNTGTFPNMLKIPPTMKLPDSVKVLGNGEGVSKIVYRQAMEQLKTPPHSIDPAIFNEYSVIRRASIVKFQKASMSSLQWFNLPWGDITLYSSLADESIEFPCYPEEYEDNVKANYTQMPEMLYQYEPWQIFQSSGPRSNQFEFEMHRDMWTGDHRDGKCNELIRFCEANCFPEYNGSAVNTSIVSLYIKGNLLISGVMTDVSVNWDGPIGLDGWYLHCKLTLTITEVSPSALNFSSVRNKKLIN